ncbi:MAG: ANTAR domain-containing response regulator [Thermodesulfobacteriota bacterium]|nr:MAG: ANTAR domain-containing response regulator [Thermodesulfobacteriota bacterium]
MLRIAVIDDNASVREVIKGFIEECGFVVAGEGADGSEAVTLCKTERPDLVIMDVSMPVKDGIDAALEINEECPTPVIILTARGDYATVKRAREAGVMAYLMKPVRFEDFLPAVELSAARFKEFSELRKENRTLKETLEARKVIEKAKGLVMEREKVTENEAFCRIRRLSMDRRRTMKDVAAEIIRSMEEGRFQDKKS